MKKQSGLSLVELMVTLAIAAVLLTYAIPNMREFLLRQTLHTKANDMLVDFVFARAEAINRGEPIKITANTNWKSGWEITDKDGIVLRKSNDVEVNVTFEDNVTETTAIVFKPTGTLNASTARIINLKNDEVSHVKILTVALSGNSSVK